MRFSWLLEKSSLLSSVFGATGVEDVADSSVKQVAIIGELHPPIPPISLNSLPGIPCLVVVKTRFA